MKLPPKPLCVLVVDDDAMSRELLAALLAAQGYEVLSAESGEISLRMIERKQITPDLVLADLQMPGLAGSQLADRFRGLCGDGALLLAMSGSEPPAAALSSFNGFLMKPFGVEEVGRAWSTYKSAAEGVWSSEEQERSSLDLPMIHLRAGDAEKASNKTMDAQLQEIDYSESETAVAVDAVASPVLNEKIYQQLASSIPTQQLHEMYSLCMNDARERISVMRTLVAQHDSNRFIREAHAIKGSCGMLGATQLHGMAAELERCGLEPTGTESAEEVNSLDELSAACDRLERMLGSRV